jgi:EAL and modified HD-GYP domain-containing signal transduction protein
MFSYLFSDACGVKYMSKNDLSQCPDCAGLFFIRLPVLDRNHEVWGYEVAAGGRKADEKKVGECVLGQGLQLGLDGLREQVQILIPMSRDMLLEKRYRSLSGGRFSIQLGPEEGSDEDTDVLAALRTVRRDGIGVALDRFEPGTGRDRLAAMADILKIPVADRPPRSIIAAAQALKNFSARLVAVGVGDWETFEGVRALGFSYYQGAYYGRPRLEPGRQLSPAALGKLRILGKLLSSDQDLQDTAELIASDPILSYRLLRFINSAAFCLVQRVSSVEQAVNLLGFNVLRQWAMFMVVTDMDTSGKGEELAYLSLLRGRFLQLCSRQGRSEPLSEHAMFLLGMFSLLDALLGLPMEEALAGLPVEQGIADGLLQRPGRGSQWIALVRAVEREDWRGTGMLCGALGLPPRVAAVSYLRASAWAAKRAGCSPPRPEAD